MTRRRLAVLVALAAAVLAALPIVLWRPRGLSGQVPDDGFARVAGVLHVHTTASDGGGTPEQVVAEARRSGLGFLVITDHNTLAARRVEGVKGGLLVLVGTEISTQDGHVLGLGVTQPVFRFSGDVDDALDDVRHLGGLAFAAHPTSPREDFRFSAWDRPGPWGVELINGDSQWRAAGWWRLGTTAALYGLNHRYALLRSLSPPAETLRRWDERLASRDVPALAGADAHARVPLTKTRSLGFPSYESLFSLVRTHVLLEAPPSGDFAADSNALLRALGRGRSYVGIDALAPAGGFSFVAEGGGARATMGETVAPNPALRLRAGGRLPEGTRLLLLRDGRALLEGSGEVALASPAPGVYRVEAYVPGWDVPWILSNPIYVFPPGEAEARRLRAAWPEAPPVPAPRAILASFDDGRSPFNPEFDASSHMDPGVVQRGVGPDGSPAARLSFRLGVPGPGRPFTWCALVSREARDLRGSDGLSFQIRGDRDYRIWVQVRDENPASATEGTEWWFASVRATPQWRRVALPFRRLRTLDPRSDGRVDLDRVRQLVFVLDPGAIDPGTAGEILIDEVGLY